MNEMRRIGAVEVPVQPVVGPPIVGWRYWCVSKLGEIRLASLSFPNMLFPLFWPPDRPMEAFCFNFLYHEAPAPLYRTPRGELVTECDPDYPCGIYAFRDEESISGPPPMKSISSRRGDITLVCGPVELWGRVIPYEHGYRAEYARPVGPLKLLKWTAVSQLVLQVADKLADTYGVEVLVDTRSSRLVTHNVTTS